MSTTKLICVLFTITLAGWLSSCPANAEEQPTQPQLAMSFSGTLNKPVSMRYLLYLPENHDASELHRWPLVIFLHGSGERGNDIEQVKKYGPSMLIATGQSFLFILASPQLPADEEWTRMPSISGSTICSSIFPLIRIAFI